ncbi:hypothetical protein [Corynebacterium parakroppenstedtii]|uniref:hypothetical protein n=1 Tax=Corynebacterium parakroppenstedtii TaxID=2828363 RepID=UPI001F3435BE|nr:hypothetical protein [Corynebacterium parakroppenstedtii]MCF7182828.1 hypothetical protein [Corynebacterium parakroppenstedtii]
MMKIDTGCAGSIGKGHSSSPLPDLPSLSARHLLQAPRTPALSSPISTSGIETAL